MEQHGQCTVRCHPEHGPPVAEVADGAVMLSRSVQVASGPLNEAGDWCRSVHTWNAYSTVNVPSRVHLGKPPFAIRATPTHRKKRWPLWHLFLPRCRSSGSVRSATSRQTTTVG